MKDQVSLARFFARFQEICAHFLFNRRPPYQSRALLVSLWRENSQYRSILEVLVRDRKCPKGRLPLLLLHPRHLPLMLRHLNQHQMLHQKHHQRRAKNHQRRSLSRMLKRPQRQVVDEEDLKDLLAQKKRPRRRSERTSSSHWQLEESCGCNNVREQERKRLIMFVDNVLKCIFSRSYTYWQTSSGLVYY